MAEYAATSMSRQELRRRIMFQLRSDQDFEAFCLDYFGEVQQRFTQGMDRLSKINLLLELEDAKNIWLALDQFKSHSAFGQHRRILYQYRALTISSIILITCIISLFLYKKNKIFSVSPSATSPPTSTLTYDSKQLGSSQISRIAPATPQPQLLPTQTPVLRKPSAHKTPTLARKTSEVNSNTEPKRAKSSIELEEPHEQKYAH